MSRIVCYSARGLGRVHAHLRGAIKLIKKFPAHPKRKPRKKGRKRKTKKIGPTPAATAKKRTRKKATKKKKK